MTRIEAVTLITNTLASLDDERVLTVADIVAEIAGDDAPYPLRELTPREHALIERSMSDFATGRTRSVEESESYVTARLAALRATRDRT